MQAKVCCLAPRTALHQIHSVNAASQVQDVANGDVAPATAAGSLPIALDQQLRCGLVDPEGVVGPVGCGLAQNGPGCSGTFVPLAPVGKTTPATVGRSPLRLTRPRSGNGKVLHRTQLLLGLLVLVLVLVY